MGVPATRAHVLPRTFSTRSRTRISTALARALRSIVFSAVPPTAGGAEAEGALAVQLEAVLGQADGGLRRREPHARPDDGTISVAAS